MTRADLPQEVQLVQNFFEKARSFNSDQRFMQNLTFAGEIVNTFRHSKGVQEILTRSLNQQSVIIQEQNKKQYKFTVALE